MRGLLFIGTLIALAFVAYLQMRGAETALQAEAAESKMEQVEQDVNAAMRQRMENLQKQEP